MPSAAALIAAVPAAAGTVASAPGGAEVGAADAFAAALAGVREGVVKDAPAKMQGETAGRALPARSVGRLDLAGLGDAEVQEVSVVAVAVSAAGPEGAIVQVKAFPDERRPTLVPETAEIADREAPDVEGSLLTVSQGPLAPAAPPAPLSVAPSAATGDEAAASAPASSAMLAAAPDAAGPKATPADVLSPQTTPAVVGQREAAVPQTAATPTEGDAAVRGQGSDAPPASKVEKPDGAALEHPLPAKAKAEATAAPAPAVTPQTAPVVRETAKPEPTQRVASTDPLSNAPAAPAREGTAPAAAATPKAAASDARPVETPAAVNIDAVHISAVIQKPGVGLAPLARPVAVPAPAVVSSSTAEPAQTDDAAATDVAAEPAATSQDVPSRPNIAAAPVAAPLRHEAPPLRPLRHETPAPSISGPADASQAAPSPAAAESEVKPEAPTLADAPSGPVAPPATTDPAAAPLDQAVDAAPADTTPDAARADNPAAQARDPLASALSRATIETTAHLAAQIARKLEGRSTRFDMVLTPEDLGRVDVTVEIDSDGQLAARLAFDNPAAAADLRGRADELRRQLQDAGFQLSQDSLDFSQRDPSSGGGAFDRQQQRNSLFAGGSRLAAQADLAAAPIPGAWTNHSLTPERVDVRV